MRRIVPCLLSMSLACATLAHADVKLLQHRRIAQKLLKADKDAGKASIESMQPGTRATGSVHLIDASGLGYFINTDITFSTSSSASGGMSEASYTHAVAASTLNGGTTSSTLNDSFDGYNSICISFTGALITCETGNSDFVIYNQNGPPDANDCGGRQVIFPDQTATDTNDPNLVVTMSRKVYVPDNDTFARWLNIFTNDGNSPVTFNMITGNNLGSDNNTVIDGTSSGDTTADPNDMWVTTFQAYSGTTSSDPRLGHVLWGPGAPVPLEVNNFVDTDDNPFWGYTLTLDPNETAIIMNFVTGQPSRAAARAKAAELMGLPQMRCNA